MKTSILLVLCLLCISCGPKPQVVTRAAYVQDKLTYLVENADFVGVVLVTDITNSYKQVSPHLRVIKAGSTVVEATVTEVVKGSVSLNDDIVINLTPQWIPPGSGAIATLYMMKQEPHLAFLKHDGKQYVPLTDGSMVPIRDGWEGGIWNRTELPDMVIQSSSVTNTIARLKELTTKQTPNK
jgi:hypothetical protein